MKFRFREPKELEKPINPNPPMEITYRWEYGMLVPICPNCGEMPYEDDCIFCHQKIIWIKKPKKYQDIVFKKGNVKITQIYGVWSIYVEVNNITVCRMECTREFTKNELEELANKYIAGGKNGKV